MSQQFCAQMFPHMAAARDITFDVAVRGCRLSIDRYEDSAFIETEPEFNPIFLNELVELAHTLGYEMLGEDECMAEDLPDGGLRHWMFEQRRARAMSVVA